MSHSKPIMLPLSVKDHSDAFAIIQAVVDFFNIVGRENKRPSFDVFPSAALYSYYVDFYYAQVCNGGHSQFYVNCSIEKREVLFVYNGLKEMGDPSYIRLFNNFLNWVNHNPIVAEQQTGFGDVPQELEYYDTVFFTLEKQTGITVLNAKWITSLDETVYVEHTDYEDYKNKVLKEYFG